MRVVVLLGALLVYGSMPVYAHKAKGMQRIASAVKGKMGQFVATGAIASALLFTAPTGVEAGQYAEAASQAAIETDRELAGEMQQLTNDTLARHHSQLVPTQLLFPIPGLLDSLPASVRKLEVSKIKHGLQQLIARIDEVVEKMTSEEERLIYGFGIVPERIEWIGAESSLKYKRKTELAKKLNSTDQLLQYLGQQIDTVNEFYSLEQPLSKRDKFKLARNLGILQTRTNLTLNTIEKLERDKAKKRRRLWRFGR